MERAAARYYRGEDCATFERDPVADHLNETAVGPFGRFFRLARSAPHSYMISLGISRLVVSKSRQ